MGGVEEWVPLTLTLSKKAVGEPQTKINRNDCPTSQKSVNCYFRDVPSLVKTFFAFTSPFSTVSARFSKTIPESAVSATQGVEQ